MLHCGICGGAIHGFSGLQELSNLQRHMQTKHKFSLNTKEVLELRLEFERAVEDDLPG